MCKNLYSKNTYNVGYIGVGKYSPKQNKKMYICWRDMIRRCYNEKEREKYPNYINCTVCEEWHNFQNFAEWFIDNYYEVHNEKMELDKDILYKGNKVYSPENCLFVPHNINVLFINRKKLRGNLPIGVKYREEIKRPFISEYNLYKPNEKNIKIHIGCFNNVEDAFYAYKEEKEKHIKEVAELYKDKIPMKLYRAMRNWKIEITD